MPRLWPRGFRAVRGEFWCASRNARGFWEIAAACDQARLRKTERIRKRVMSATDSEDAAAPLQYVIPDNIN